MTIKIGTITSLLDKACINICDKNILFVKMKVTVGDEILDNRGKNFICGAVEGFYGRPWSTEQRKLLFSWLKKMGMNTYMYAPKDDCKHRAFWRELYSVEEADHMTGLIDAAREYNIEFVFALSPGLDITFSNAKDVQALKRKLEQSCNDHNIFVWCQIEQNLKIDIVEYCTSRALPNLPSSGYLNTIGAKLHPGVDILWTGCKVITKKISIQHLQEVSAVLRRPPVIWDNIHANDYDVRRLFLGPYDGRSPEIIPYLRGVLTNPNCEFETNYIPLHTLGQWSKSNSNGLKKDVISECDRLSPVASVIKLETELEFVCDDDIPLRLDTRYQPRQALRTAINEWMFEVTMRRLPPPRLVAPSPPVQPLINDNVNNLPLLPVTSPVETSDSVMPCNRPEIPEHLNHEEIVNESYMQPTMNPVNSLIIDTVSSEDSESISSTEPMECMPSPNALNNSSDNLMQVEICSCESIDNVNKFGCDSTSCVLKHGQITYEDLSLLADLFYMPFEHGLEGVQLLQDLYWLKCNAYVLSSTKSKEESLPEVTEWNEKADGFIASVKKVTDMTKRLYAAPNISLAHDIFPYLWDLVGILQTCSTYVAWLKFGKMPRAISPSTAACPPSGHVTCMHLLKAKFFLAQKLCC
ncbi:hypothetical protein KUTeg_005510 [Tegillarca granosa]|uniref:GH84 domain-containing protein n=1 Tax=Tegillarca granosa TaxID=220873 RepID=A0ABQ9FN71_TEGGR|nr:hypothetical protein KUTeg_005510 [Tegillarca granosa]